MTLAPCIVVVTSLVSIVFETYDSYFCPSIACAILTSSDASFGLPPKMTLSQRDVPGTTRAAISVLRRNGVQAITVGVNTASAYPEVPK